MRTPLGRGDLKKNYFLKKRKTKKNNACATAHDVGVLLKTFFFYEELNHGQQVL